MSTDAFVIGAGVIGLSTALRLARSGLRTTVYAAAPPHRTTSAAAGALWGPHLVGADDRVPEWAAQTLEHFRGLAADPAAGVRDLAGVAAAPGRHESGPGESGGPGKSGGPGESGGPSDADVPPFLRGADGLSRCDPATLPGGFAVGWRYRAPVIAMPDYLDYLLAQVLAAGGEVRLGPPLPSLAAAAARTTAPVLVNCAGIGARDLVPDPDLEPVRGQVVVVANPGLTEFFVGEGSGPDEVSYIFPHGATAVLGGTQRRGDASTAPDPATAARILAQCTAIEPRLAGAPVLAHRVGLRPVRPRVRLAAGTLADGRAVVHNYGHGGAGVTLSWGCAGTAAGQVTRLLG